MSAPDDMDRKSFLKASLAWAAVTLSGCGTSGGSGGGTGGAHSGGSGGGTGGSATGGGPGTGGTTAGSGGNASSTGGATGSGTGGMTGSGGDSTGGRSGGVTWQCMADTFNGSHSHPLMIPSSDVERGFQDAPYLLEDGGTGHTHTVEVTAYDFIYLRGGAISMIDSTTTNGHLHKCTIACSAG